jgi:hypothetical protein
MNQAKKLLIYFLINVIVSAITIIAVLYLWENTQLKKLLFENEPGTETDLSPGTDKEPVEEISNLLIEIGEVGGVGNIATEYIRLVRPPNDTAETVSLQDWRIKGEDNREFSILEQSGLASLDLHSQGAVNIYTKDGVSNPIELYLGLSDPIWQPGETVTLIDPQGEVHDTYLIP